MSNVDDIIEKWDNELIRTHSEECWQWHPTCAIALLADEIYHLRLVIEEKDLIRQTLNSPTVRKSRKYVTTDRELDIVEELKLYSDIIDHQEIRLVMVSGEVFQEAVKEIEYLRSLNTSLNVPSQ